MYVYTSTQEISACTEVVEKVAKHLSATISITLGTKRPKACIYQQQMALPLWQNVLKHAFISNK